MRRCGVVAPFRKAAADIVLEATCRAAFSYALRLGLAKKRDEGWVLAEALLDAAPARVAGYVEDRRIDADKTPAMCGAALGLADFVQEVLVVRRAESKASRIDGLA